MAIESPAWMRIGLEPSGPPPDGSMVCVRQERDWLGTGGWRRIAIGCQWVKKIDENIRRENIPSLITC
jgi:hypothetical protein